jgi:hypothetical protein
MTTVTRTINEITREEAEELVAQHVEKRPGFEFFLMVNKSAALFRRRNPVAAELSDEWGLVLGNRDGVQFAGDSFRFEFVLYREPTVIYDAKLTID